MAEALYSKQEHAQFRGPTTSDNYNERVENAYRDLTYLFNRVALADEDLKNRFTRLVKDHFSLMKMVEDLSERVEALEEGDNMLTFFSHQHDDSERFNSSDYEIPLANRLSIDTRHGVMTLPKVDSSSLSKLGFVDDKGNFVIPSTFEELASGVAGTADSGSAVIRTSDVYNSVMDEPGKVWERNVIAPSVDADGAKVNLYVRMPTDLATTVKTNAIVVHPFPMMGCDLMSVATSSSANINLNDNDGYVPVNSADFYEGDQSAVGWTPPGAWTNDEIINCGPKIFYFDPREVNGVKIQLRQKNYFTENSSFIYSYGLSFLDVRYDKFLSSGKAIIRFDAPNADTISVVDNVLPEIYNVSEAEIDEIFSYRVIWETSFNSGVYTLDPVPFSQRVWIEITMNETLGDGTPALSGLKVEYS